MRYSKKYSIVANGVENKWNKIFNIALTGHKSNMVTTRAPPTLIKALWHCWLLDTSFEVNEI